MMQHSDTNKLEPRASNLEPRTSNLEAGSNLEPRTSNLEPAPTLFDYLALFVKRWRLIAGITLVATIISIIVVLLIPGIYTAKAMILPREDDKGVMGAMMAQLGGLGGVAGIAGGGLGGATKAGLYVTMLKSETVKDPIIDRFKLKDLYEAKFRSDVYTALDKNVIVTAGKKDGVITIAVDDKNPKRAADLANAYVDELGKLAARLNMTSAGKDRGYLEERLAAARVDLAKAEDALKAFQAKNKAVSVTDQAKATIEGVAQLRAQLAAQEVQLATFRRQFTESSQEVKTAKSTAANLQAQIVKLEGNGEGSSSIPSVGSMPQLGQEYLRLMREFRIQETLVELLAKQYEVAKLSEVKDVSPFHVLQNAKVPERRSKPVRRKIVTIVFLAALAGSCALVLALDNFQKLRTGINSQGSQ
ncbi:GumC family protein [Geotalea uraniireducens]|uniref:Lipopolysaccharide biosynthesis protein n=1 Tax=Geotalea uraniireducens (strain Rf4) TaxID=351605 RepID=A5G614_GEOUR|nr:Wzz/FepE/Etk N-terminal domain-containing protein [Geotalea uraniireducens]ABQ27232.1 lipopolysaccharide biosynthesis protein [Geotalea uraniireducens Rf4]